MLKENDLVNNEIVKHWLMWGFFWGIFAPGVGILLSLKFNYPNLYEQRISSFRQVASGARERGCVRCVLDYLPGVRYITWCRS